MRGLSVRGWLVVEFLIVCMSVCGSMGLSCVHATRPAYWGPKRPLTKSLARRGHMLSLSFDIVIFTSEC